MTDWKEEYRNQDPNRFRKEKRRISPLGAFLICMIVLVLSLAAKPAVERAIHEVQQAVYEICHPICGVCGGLGKVYNPYLICTGMNEYMGDYVTCGACGGRGRQ